MITLHTQTIAGESTELSAAIDHVNSLYGDQLTDGWNIRFSYKPYVSGHDWDYWNDNRDEICYTAKSFIEAVSGILELDEIAEID